MILLGVFVWIFLHKNADKRLIELDLAREGSLKEVSELEAHPRVAPGEEVEILSEASREAAEKEKTEEKEAFVASSNDSSVTSKEGIDEKSDLEIKNRLVTWGFQKSSGRKIDTVIIHSSYDALGDDPYAVSGVIAEYKKYEVAPHYLIDRKGKIYQLVEDKNIAYHAGESMMPDGRTGVNAFSIGVEMLTTKKDKLTEAQYLALNLLIANLKGKYKITAVLGHNQIAPGRKDDPWNFDWKKVKK